MKKRKILYLFPLAGLVLSGCDFNPEELLKNTGAFFTETIPNTAKDVFNKITGKEDAEEEQKEEEKQSGEEEGQEGGGQQGGGEGSGGEGQGGEGGEGQGGEGGGGGEQQTKKDFEGLSLPNATYTYDGQPHSLEVAGDLPEGATVDYGTAGNTFTDVGQYDVTATVSAEGYNDLVLHGTLTILASDFVGLAFEDATFEYDGEPHSISVTGELPEGAEVTYSPGNSFTEIGEHEVTATVSCEGYTDLVLHATLTITIGNMVGVTFEDQEVPFDGDFHEITPNIPAKYVGATVEYGENGNSFVASGLHVVEATVSCPGYNDLQLSAKLIIGPGEAANQNMNVVDFEGMIDNDVVDEFTLEFYNNGWVKPQAAKLGIEKNQAFAGGENTMKMTLTHQGSAFKATKTLYANTYCKYKGFSVDTMMDSRAEGGTMKVQVQFWFKDLPLPDAYAGYRNTYATYTLSNNAPSIWTHWEVPFDDESLSIASSATITEYFLAAGYTVEEFSPYIDKVAIIITPNYKDGKNCYAYIDNIQLTTSEEKVVDKFIYGGKYVHIEGENAFALDLADDLATGSFLLNDTEVSALTITKNGDNIVAKDATYAGAGLTVAARIEDDGSLTVVDVQGQAATEYSGLVDMNFAKHANVNLDFTNETTGTTYVNSHWYQEYWNNTWIATSGQMRVRGDGSNPHINAYCAAWMDYRYTYSYPEEFGLADKFSIDLSNDFSGSADIKLKIKLLKSNGGEVYMAGSADDYEIIPAGTAKWHHIEETFDEINVKAIAITIKSTRESGQYMYFDNIKLEHSLPEVTPPPQPTYTVEDGEYYIWNGAEDAYRLTIADSQTTGSFTKCGSEDSYDVTVAVDGNNVTIKDAAYAGAGLTVNAVLTDNNLMTVDSVSGAMASVLSASLTGKTVKHGASVNLDFADGTNGNTYTNSHWTEQHYGNSGWTSYATPTQMRAKLDKNNNKIVNFAASTTAYNFLYTPDLPTGPVNHLEVDLGNYYQDNTIRYKIALLGSDGNVAKYAAGDANNWASIAFDNSNGNYLETQSFDFGLVVAYKVRITVSTASGTGYLYMDNLKVSYKAPEPTPAFAPTGDLLGGARIRCTAATGTDTPLTTALNVGGAGNGDFSGSTVYLRMKNNTGTDTPIRMKFNSTNGAGFGPKPDVAQTYYNAAGEEITGCAPRDWDNYLMLPANFDGWVAMNYETQMSRIFGTADFDPAHMWRVYIEYSGSYDAYADFTIGDIVTDEKVVLDGSSLDAAAFAATWENAATDNQAIEQQEGGVIPDPVYSLVDGDYYIWNGSSDAFRVNISNSLTSATVTKCGGDSYAMTVAVDGNDVTIKDAGYAGAGLTIAATLTADNTMTITGVTGQMASIFSGSLLNKTVKHCASVDLDFQDGTTGSAYKGAGWSEQKYTSAWTDVANPEMNCRADDNGSKVVNLAADGSARNFIYDMDLPMGPVNHLDIDIGNYFSTSSDPISYKIAVIDAGGTKYYAAGDANNFATIAKNTANGNALQHFSLDFNLCVGDKLQITTKASGSSYLYIDNVHVSYRAAADTVAYKLVDTTGWDITGAGAEFYAWVWGGNDAGHWEALTLNTDDGNYFNLSLFKGYTGMKIVRVNPDSAKKPTVGSTKYGSYTNEQVWNETANITLNGAGGNVNFSF